MILYQVITEVNENDFGMVIDHIWQLRSGNSLPSCMVKNQFIH